MIILTPTPKIVQPNQHFINSNRKEVWILNHYSNFNYQKWKPRDKLKKTRFGSWTKTDHFITYNINIEDTTMFNITCLEAVNLMFIIALGRNVWVGEVGTPLEIMMRFLPTVPGGETGGPWSPTTLGTGTGRPINELLASGGVGCCGSGCCGDGGWVSGGWWAGWARKLPDRVDCLL